MNPEAQRIAIAKACGLPLMTDGWVPTYADPDNCGFAPVAEPADIPDYLNDLNAMHDAEKFFNDDEATWHGYKFWLLSVIEPHRHEIHATASQRAEAFLRTLNLWTE